MRSAQLSVAFPPLRGDCGDERGDVPEEPPVTRAEIVEPRLAFRGSPETVFRTFSVAHRADFATEADCW